MYTVRDGRLSRSFDTERQQKEVHELATVPRDMYSLLATIHLLQRLVRHHLKKSLVLEVRAHIGIRNGKRAFARERQVSFGVSMVHGRDQ